MQAHSEARVIGRLAPSPTGAQHVGNARTYLLAWLSIRLQGGRLLLRIEDIDSPRVKAAASQQAIEDLQWLGLDWDPSPKTVAGGTEPFPSPSRPTGAQAATVGQADAAAGVPAGVWLQTQRLAVYRGYLKQLRGAGRIFPCYCSRRDIEEAASAPHDADRQLQYPGTCRPTAVMPGSPATSGSPGAAMIASADEDAGPGKVDRNGDDNRDGNGTDGGEAATQRTALCAWRFLCSDDAVRFDDGLRGPLTSRPASDWGDFVVGRGQTPDTFDQVAYQLAVTVDDHDMGVTEVVRGDDLIPSTFWQLELYRALGWSPPRFAHVPLVVGPDGRRLAKRHGDTRLAEIRRRGLGPERLLGVLAHSCGLVNRPCSITAPELLESLQRDWAATEPAQCGKDLAGKWKIWHWLWQRIPRSPFVLTNQVWRSLSGQGPRID